MKLRASIVVAGLLFAGVTVLTASPASAAAPRCSGQGWRYNMINPYEKLWFPAHSPDSRAFLLSPTGEWVTVGYGFWSCSLVQGSTGEGVRQLQVDMNACYSGLIGTPLSEDGLFGSRTKAALIKVQQWHGIEANGQYGPQTARTMQHHGYNDNEGSKCKTLSEMGFPGNSG